MNPFEEAAAELDAEYAKKGGTTPQSKYTTMEPIVDTGNPFEDAAREIDAEAGTGQQAATQRVQGAGTPDNPFQAVVQFGEMLQKARQVGQAGFRESALGHAVMNGNMTFEEAEAQIAADDDLAAASQDIEQYQKDSIAPWLTGVAVETAKALPMIEASLAPAAGGFAVAGGGTALTGIGAPVAIPVGLAAGAAATTAWATDFISGQEYMEMRRHGLSDDIAKPASAISGLVQGLLQTASLGSFGKLTVTAAKGQLATHAKTFAAAMPQVLSKVGSYAMQAGKFITEQEVIAEAQAATKLIVEAIAGTVGKTPGAVPTVEQAAKEFWQTFDVTLKSSIGMFGLGKVSGKTAALALKPILRKAVNTHLANQQQKINYAQTKFTKAQARQVASARLQAARAKQLSQPVKKPTKAQRKANQLTKRQLKANARHQERLVAEAEINKIFNAVSSKIFVHSADAQQTKALLEQMVRKSAKLTDAAKVKLLQRVMDLDTSTLQTVNALMDVGSDFIYDQRMAEQGAEVAAETKRLYALIKKGQPKENKAVMQQEAQASMQWYKEFFTPIKPEKRPPGSPRRGPGGLEAEIRKLGRERAEDYIARGYNQDIADVKNQIKAYEEGKISDYYKENADKQEKLRIATLAQKFWSGKMDAAAIKQLTDDIESQAETGRSKFQEQKYLQAESYLKDRDIVKAAVQGLKTVVPSKESAPPKRMTAIGKFLNELRRNGSALWDKLLQDTPLEERKPVINDILDFTEAENKEAEINIRASRKLHNLYASAVGSLREAKRLIHDGANSKQRIRIDYTDAVGLPTHEYHTVNELVYLSIAMEDSGAVPGLVKGNRYTLDGMVNGGVSTQEAIRNFLKQHESGKYDKLAGAIQEFYQWFAPQIANHYLKEYGVELEMHPDYSGRIMHRQLETFMDYADLLNNVQNMAAATLNPGSTKLRQNSSLPLKLYDPFDQVLRAHTEMAFWIAHSEQARRLQFIFSDTKQDGLRDIIGYKLGEEFNSLIDSRIAFQYHLKPGVIGIANDVYATIKGRMATGFLGARLDQGPKQWTGVLHALSTCNYKEFLDGLRASRDKKAVQEYLTHSALFKDRRDHLVNAIKDATGERNFVDAITGDRALEIKQFLLIPMHKWGDGVGASLAGFIEFNRARKAGASVEEAALAGDRLVDTTQSSSRASQKTPMEFNRNLLNLMLAFAKEGIQSMNRESSAYRDVAIHGDAAAIARAARVFVSIHAAQALFQSINVLPAWVLGTDEEKLDGWLRVSGAALGGSYAMVPLLGVDVGYGLVTGWQGRNEPRTIIGGLTADLTKGIKRFGKLAVKAAGGEPIEGEDWIKAFDSFASLASVGSGIPFWGLWSYTKLGSKAVNKAAGNE